MIQSQLMLFEVGDWRFSVENSQSQHVLRRNELNKIQYLPEMQKPLIGITNIFGHAVPILDVGALWDSPDVSSSRNVLVLGNKNSKHAILIDSLPKNFADFSLYEKSDLNLFDIPEYIKLISQFIWKKPNDNQWVLHLSDYNVLIKNLKLEED